MTDNGDPAQETAGQWSYGQAHLPPADPPDESARPERAGDQPDGPIFGTSRTGAIPPVGAPAASYDPTQYGAPVYGSAPPDDGGFAAPTPEGQGRHSQFGSDGFPEVHYYAHPGADPSVPAASDPDGAAGAHGSAASDGFAAPDGSQASDGFTAPDGSTAVDGFAAPDRPSGTDEPGGSAAAGQERADVAPGSYPSAEFGSPFGLPPAPFYADAAAQPVEPHPQGQHAQGRPDQGVSDPSRPDQNQYDQNQYDQNQYDQNRYQFDPNQNRYDQSQYSRDAYGRDQFGREQYGREPNAGAEQHVGTEPAAYPPAQYAPDRSQDRADAAPPSGQQQYQPDASQPRPGTSAGQPGPQYDPGQRQSGQQYPAGQQPTGQQYPAGQPDFGQQPARQTGPQSSQPQPQPGHVEPWPGQPQPGQQQSARPQPGHGEPWPGQQQSGQQQSGQQQSGQPGQPQPGQAQSGPPTPYGTPGPGPDTSRPQGPLPTAAQPRPESLLVPSHRAMATEAAQAGWQGQLRRLSGGLIKAQPSVQERADRKDSQDIQRTFSRPMTIVVVQPKGGAGKTPATIGLASALGAHRGGYVVGWDDNETRGTLAVRVDNADKQTTTVWDLLSDLSMFERTNARVGDLSHYVRSQGAAQFDALVSDDSPGNMAQIGELEFKRIHTVLQRFYRQIVVDTGNNVRSPNWQAAVNAADQIVVVSTYQRDVGYSGSWVLDHLIETGRAELAAGAITVLSAADPRSDPAVRRELIAHFGARTRAVVEIPYDPLIALGGPIEWLRLKPETRRAWTHAGASVVTALAAQDEAERMASRNPG